MRRVLVGALALIAATAACAGAPSTSDGESEDDIAKRARHYVDVSADAPMNAVARDKILRALSLLDRVARESASPLRRALASETLARIESGDVLIGSIEASRGIDRWHMCRDEKLPVCEGAPPPADDRTWRGDAELAKTLERDLAGYQWGNRIYFTLSAKTDVRELAATLVHEVVHVANRSECSYYEVLETHDVDDDRAYVEELRSFLAECLYGDEAATVASCATYAAGRVGEYGFHERLSRILPKSAADPRAIAERLVAAEPEGDARLGRLVPRKKHWPSAFGACAPR